MESRKPLARFVPESYRSVELDGATVWLHPSESVDFPLLPQMQTALDSVQGLLAFRICRALHFVVYASSADAASCLGRRVANTFLLSPLHTVDTALVVFHSPRLHEWNRDTERMRRHLCHELSHVCSAERTGSIKTLGDDNSGMRLPAWIDEGFAECVAARVAERPEIIARALASVGSRVVEPASLDAALMDLESPQREDAFLVATAVVWRAVERLGFHEVFAMLDQPQRWL